VQEFNPNRACTLSQSRTFVWAANNRPRFIPTTYIFLYIIVLLTLLIPVQRNEYLFTCFYQLMLISNKNEVQ